MSRHGLHGGSASTAKLASVSICSGPPAQMTARNIARAESNDAEPSSGTASNDAASTIAAQRWASVGLPGQHRDPAGEHGERGVVLDAGVAERREPPLHGRHLADAVRGEDQLRHQLHAPVSLRGVEQVLERRGRGSVRLVPVGRSQVQLGDQLGLDSAQLREQELPEQRVVAEPLPPTVEGDEEQARGLQAPELLAARRIHRAAHRRAVRTAGRATAVRRRNRWVLSGSSVNDSR